MLKRLILLASLALTSAPLFAQSAPLVFNNGRVVPMSGPLPIATGGTNASTATAATSNLQYLQGATGSAARSVTSKLQDYVHTADFAGCDPTGATDSTTCVQNALNAYSGGGGGVVHFRGKYLIGTNLTIPTGVTLQGNCNMPGTQGANASTPYGNYTCGVLMVASTATITLGAGSGLEHAIIYRSGMTFPAADSSAFAGTAITNGGDDTHVYGVLVMGFNKGYYSSGYQRPRIEYMFGDNLNGIEITNALDIPYIAHCHMWPFATIATGGVYTNHVRSGYAYYLHDTVDWGKISDSFSWGYFRGIRLLNVSSTTIVGGGADNAYSAGAPQYANTIGLSIENSGDTRVFGFQAAAQANAGIYVTSAGLQTYLDGTAVWGGSTHAIQIDGGDVVIAGALLGTNSGITNGVTVNNLSSHVFIGNVRFGTLTGNPINVAVANSTTVVAANDYGPYNGAVAGANLSVPSVASAAVLTIPNTGSIFNVTGTTNFGTLNNGWAGRCVTLVFGGILTVLNSTGAYGAMHLNAGANLTTAANDNISLCHSGVQWYEVGRSH